MAKKKKMTTRGAPTHRASVGAAAVAAVTQVPVITVPPGGTLTIVVDVGPMAIQYTVGYAGKTLITSLVDRAEDVPLQAGDRILAWSFAHVVKGWSHAIGFSINGGPVQVLERKSEANKDPDHSVGVAVVKA